MARRQVVETSPGTDPGTTSEAPLREQIAGDRFRPTRCGIINLWDYRDEEFVFADGRMVLRGPNGSGKTKALEVLFPFVFDGRVEPRRLNPFAGEERTMKSNLLYRGQDSAYAYVWMEFRREAGAEAAGKATAEVVTVGVGLRAQRQNDRVTRWYFVVDGQVGRDFSLLGPDDRPLTRRQLAEQIGADVVTDRPVEHRQAIDARLFGLGAQRYEQLLTLILTLRRPQLAKNLDPKSLSQALSDGLRPLDDSLITEAAHSFGDMESVQRTLAGLVLADMAAGSFLAGYTTYLRTHARAAADILTARLDQVETSRVRLVGSLSEQRTSARAQLAARARQEEIAAERTTLGARLDSLKASSAYRSREALGRLAELTQDLQAAAGRDHTAAERATAELTKRLDAVRRAEDAHQLAVSAVSRAAGDLLESAQEAGIAWQPVDQAEDGSLAVRAAARTAARDDDVAVVRARLTQVEEARRVRDRANQVLERAQLRLTGAQRDLDAAEAALIDARAALLEALQAWGLRQVAVLDELPDQLIPDLHAAVELLGTPDETTLTSVFDRGSAEAVQQARDDLARQQDSLARQRSEIDLRRTERAAIAAEQDEAPPPFAARTDSREGRTGAPFWAAVAFAEGVGDAEAAAVEAALEAANLLDGWVSDDWESLDPASDAVLRPLPVGLRPAGATLAGLLVPEPGGPVAESVVASLLGSIALSTPGLSGEPAAAPSISTDGRFAQGVQVGAHVKPQAEYIGATARARRRATRLADLDLVIRAAEREAAETGSTVDDLETSLASIRNARGSLPATGAVLDAGRGIVGAAAALRAVNGELDNARSDSDRAIAEVGGLDRALTATAVSRSMPTARAEVDLIAAAVVAFTRAAGALDALRLTAAARAEQSTLAQEEAAAARESQREAIDAAAESGSNHLARAEELRTLRSAVGAEAAQVERDVTDTNRALEKTVKALLAAQRELEAAIEAAGQARGRAEGASAALASSVVEAQHDSRRLAPYARPDIRDVLRLPVSVSAWPTALEQWADPEALMAEALLGLQDDPDAPVTSVPETVAAMHAAVLAATAELRPTESSLKSSRTRVSGSLAELQSQLSAAGHDYRPEWEADDEVIVVKVADEQGFSSIGEFASRIATARKDQEVLLTESERRVLEDALLGRLAQQIHERTTDARDLIGAMNREMRSRRMSSGATVGIGWELADSLDDEQKVVSRLLDREAARLSTEELTRMRAHFASQIKNLRAARPDRPYAEILADALDYRRWRTFALTLVAPDGKEDRLTQARHSTLSGGEQSVSLHLPLFAAAHVMLSSAAPHAPRLLALDEAFAGIDDPGRSELLGLTAQFDLDLFMTGYDLWATYATVPGCAHHDLSHSAVEHTVSALLLVWDGAKILTDGQTAGGSGDLAADLGSPGTRRVSAPPVGMDDLR
ncbi:uncharacterized protein (TIGR02680 family) [Nakamurella sp. UYEF19]|uniref:TIGR02680 family protein n=1 Tax=Nakamurella sp. UYEF19 TaxID=1756392 RepID=UPI00339647FC